jgi:hypothetical protein
VAATERRGRGKAYPAGVVQNEIMWFLLTRYEGAASEPEIREHVLAERSVGDRGTIRNHLEYLKKKGLIGLKKQKKGLENVWFVTDGYSVPVYVFSEFEGVALVQIFRSPFFQLHARRWYLHRFTGTSLDHDQLEAVGELLRIDASDPGGDLFPAVMTLSIDALAISPTHFRDRYGSDTRDVGHSFHVFLMGLGRGAMMGEDLCSNPAERLFAKITTDLLIDFNQYPSTQDDVLEFFRRQDFRYLFGALMHDIARGLISRYLSAVSYRGRAAIDEEVRELFSLEDPAGVDGVPS